MPASVSILIPVYNCRPWLERAVESALAQSWPDLEVIALDDCSTDGSREALERWRGRIRVEHARANGGQNVSRNHLTALARGEWLAYLDADDELLPEAVEQKMRVAPGADAVYGTMEVRQYEGDKLAWSRRIPAEPHDDALAAAFLWKYPNTSSVMFRRDAIAAAGGWNEKIRNCTDYDLYFRLLLDGRRMAAAPASVSIYRQWSRTQAVYEDSLRRTLTRLDLMWNAARRLEEKDAMRGAVREAFGNAALQAIRHLHQIDPRRSLEEHARLKSWDPRLAPSTAHFPRGYCAGYRLFGFRGAEFLARATRFSRPEPPTSLFAPS